MLVTTALLALLLSPGARADDGTAGYKKGFFISSADGDFELKIGGRVQARTELELPDGAEDPDIAFSVPRARVKLSGHAWTPDLTYNFQADWGKGTTSLKDFYVNYAFVEGVELRVGQFKRPYMRQQLTSSGNLELVDRAITDKAFGAGRDIGLMMHSDVGKATGLEWAVGVFNGSGDKTRYGGEVTVDPSTGQGELDSFEASNVPGRIGPEVVARVGYTTEDTKAYSELDLEGGGFRAGVGANAAADLEYDDGDDGELGMGLDYVIKVSGFSASGAFMVDMVQTGADFAELEQDQIGFYQQVSYVIGKVGPAARYARVMSTLGDSWSQEVTAGVAYLPFKHNVKWSTDFSLLGEGVADTSTSGIRARTELQLAF